MDKYWLAAIVRKIRQSIIPDIRQHHETRRDAGLDSARAKEWDKFDEETIQVREPAQSLIFY